MDLLTESFLKSLTAVPLMLAALYFLSIVAVSSARGVAITLLKARIVFTLIMASFCLFQLAFL